MRAHQQGGAGGGVVRAQGGSRSRGEPRVVSQFASPLVFTIWNGPSDYADLILNRSPRCLSLCNDRMHK